MGRGARACVGTSRAALTRSEPGVSNKLIDTEFAPKGNAGNFPNVNKKGLQRVDKQNYNHKVSWYALINQDAVRRPCGRPRLPC